MFSRPKRVVPLFPELIGLIIEFALPKCTPRINTNTCLIGCICPACLCTCERRIRLARELCLVSRVSYAFARPRLYACMTVSFTRAKMLLLGRTLAAGKAKKASFRVRNLWEWLPKGGADDFLPFSEKTDCSLFDPILPFLRSLESIVMGFTACDLSLLPANGRKAMKALTVCAPEFSSRLFETGLSLLSNLKRLDLHGASYPNMLDEGLFDSLASNVPPTLEHLPLGPWFDKDRRFLTLPVPIPDRHLLSIVQRVKSVRVLVVRPRSPFCIRGRYHDQAPCRSRSVEGPASDAWVVTGYRSSRHEVSNRR